MDRLNQLRGGGEASAGRDSLDSSSQSEAYMSANESSKYFSMSDSTFDITPIKDVSLASTAVDPDSTLSGPNEIISNLSPITKKDVMFDNFNIEKQTDVANILSGGVDIFDDNDNSFDGHELVIDDAVNVDDKSNLGKESEVKVDDNVAQGVMSDTPVDVASKDTEVVLQIDGKNVDAIDIGNGLYLYRKEGQEELAAVQIINDDDQQQPSFKFLKVRENAEGNLEVYEEFEIEVTKDAPTNEVTISDNATSYLPIKNMNKVMTESSSSKVAEIKDKTNSKEVSFTSKIDVETEVKETPADSKTEVNLNGKMMKFSESRKSPVVGSFTPMTYHSTPNKEGKPLTKTMVDLQLHPNRHSDNVKKTIEVHTDSQPKKIASEDSQKHKTESEAKKIVVDMISKETTKQNEELDKIMTQNLYNQENETVKDSVSVSTVSIEDSKQAVCVNPNKPVKTQPDIDKKQSVDETGVKVDAVLSKVDTFMQTKTDQFKEDIKMKEDNLAVSNIKNIESYKVLSNKKDQEKSLVSSKNAFITKTNEECKNDTTANTNLESSIDKSASGKSTNSLEIFTTKDDGKKNSTKDVVDSNKPAMGDKDPILYKPEEVQKEIVPETDTIKKDLPLPNQDKEVIFQISPKSSQKSNEVSSTLSTGQISKLIQIVHAPTDSKLPIIDAKSPVTSNSPTLHTPQLYTSLQKNSDLQLKASEKLNPKQSEPPPTITKTLNPKLELKPDKPHPQAKGFEFNTVSKIVKLNPVSASIEAKTQSLPQKSNVLEKKVELKPFPNAKKCSAAKITDLKSIPVKKKMVTDMSVPNIEKTNPAPLAIESKSFLKTEMFNSAPKTVSAPERSNVIEKKIDTKAVPKINKLCPVEKVMEPKTVSKTEKKYLAETKMKPEMTVTVDNFSVANVIPKNKDEGMVSMCDKNIVLTKVESSDKKDIKIPAAKSNSEAKPTNNNHTAVPFGKWTDANRQEFLNQFKDIKVPVSSNTKQIKNSNDLNRIDILKKIDSQRSNNASAKIQEKSNVKDSVFSTKVAPSKMESKIPVKNEGLKLKAKPIAVESNTAQQSSATTATVCPTVTAAVSSSNVTTTPAYSDISMEPTERIVNVTDLISKTIIGMLNKAPMPMTNVHNTPVDSSLVENNVTVTKPQEIQSTDTQALNEDSSGSLDDIEMKMNELHGIPFVERPPHELPKVHKSFGKPKEANPAKKLPKKQILAPATSRQSLMQDNVIDIDSDEEIIKHEPITGDIDASKKVSTLTASVKMNIYGKTIPQSSELLKTKGVITENEFDKFAGSNAIAYENCLTVKFDGKKVANVAQSVKEKDATTKLYSGHKMNQIETKTKLPQKLNTSQNKYPNLVPNTTISEKVTEDGNSKPYQSKIASAYQSALNSKLQSDRPITIIEDKPVKVVFMDANPEFITNQLNVQGKELSPAKQVDAFGEDARRSTAEILTQPGYSENTETTDDTKPQDDTKTKTKHQRKQVLNPVEVPELELIQSGAREVSPKKKRKMDDNKIERGHKNLVHKKQYLLGRGAVTDDNPQVSHSTTDIVSCTEIVTERSAVSAIDNLVKAAELLENQTQMMSDQSASPDPDFQQNTPVKRGRGRPRKYPLPEVATDIKVASPSPQKKMRLIDAKPVKRPDPVTDEDSTDGEEIIRENWTMGKINENIVCPICNKLFRSENVVFKHVKHCTGVSPSRSDSEKRSPRRMRLSRDSDSKSPDNKSDDMNVSEKSSEPTISAPKKRKSKESIGREEPENREVIVTEDTPDKDPDSKTAEDKHEKLKKVSEDVHQAVETKTSPEEKPAKVKKVPKSYSVQQPTNLVCEICEKSFRQLSYLLKHKLQHKKEQTEKMEAEKKVNKTQVFGCDVCKKEFRKLHHLVQHRIIHDPDVPVRSTRKSSSEQIDNKPLKEQTAPKQNEDLSAGFRCEPCDKSFRKLHHLVEHRETHDGINRQKSNVQAVIEKPPPPPQCNICKKTFRKLHHLVEHKEQHVEHKEQNVAHKEQHVENKEQHVEQVETSSEKSDDKSVKSALSTKDIIHECSLCYMVFPNEHSLNKHFFNCQQKKKRQSKAKEKSENVDGSDKLEGSAKSEESADEDNVVPKIVAQEIIDDDETATKDSKNENVEITLIEKPTDVEMTSSETDKVEIMKISPKPVQKEVTGEVVSTTAKRNLSKSNDRLDSQKAVPEKIKEINIDNQEGKIKSLPKKTPLKDRVAPTVTQRQKSNIAPIPVAHEGKPESSDDDEVRYMLNPDLNLDENALGKAFMKVRIQKRNSLQIERPKSHDLIKRRTSLQHPPKPPRSKGKAVEQKTVPTTTKRLQKLPKVEASSTDSDDSDVKYSFPEPVPEVSRGTPKENKAPKKSIAEKRKSLSGIAKRKSLGKAVTAKFKADPSPVRIIKRRRLDVEHRCDCGQLFNSAALLTRHTSLAHTPPRIRRRRSPPPDDLPKPARKSTADIQPTRKSSVASNVKPTRKSSVVATSKVKPTRKSSVASTSTAKPTRKSSAKSEITETRKSPGKGQAKPATKAKRSIAHSGVPVPEKMRKLFMKNVK